MPREARTGRTAAIIAAVVAVVALGVSGGLYLASRNTTPADCASGRTALRVTASPDIAPVVATVAQRMSAESQVCVDVTVTADAPAAVLAQLQTGSIQPPDVWIPNSTLWLTRAKDDKVATATDAPAIATSPLVLAVSAAEASVLNAKTRPTVADLVSAASATPPATVEIASERLAPERVGAILALRDATSTRPDGRGALTALLRSATVGTEATGAAKAASGSAAPAAAATAPVDHGARPMSEQAVWAANSGTAAPQLVAIYPSQASYNYPYAVLTAVPSAQAAAGTLLDRLTLPSSQQALRSAGFRDAAGGPGFDLTSTRGVDGDQASKASRLDATSLTDAEKTLAAVRLDAKLTTVIDVSGSMAWGIDGKGSPGPSRMDIARQSAVAGLALYPASTQVDLWAFSEKLDGDKPYKVVVPTVSLDDAGKQKLLAGVSTLQPTGGTGLYTTTIAAVRAAQASYAQGRVNAVVILSDGGDSENGQSLDQVVATLKAEAKPDRPVPVITIAFGPDADRAALNAISSATGGAAYRATSPDQIHAVFLDAVGQRACRPDCAS
ncbi:MAG TPA: substrate-binding domain-containing protein [Lapillicoccus sp.]|uniref:substrate-binding domain-containing protein n=1 Tax=Lapillicoccus sp. TaxID=1909287 RepID=UPI002F928C20